MRGKRVFVTGAAGVIGRSLVKLLEAQGADVWAADVKTKPKLFGKNIRYRRGDLNFLRREELEAFQPEIIFHLAATFERTEESPDFFEDNFHNNIKLSHHIVSLTKDIKSLRKFVFASSYLVCDANLYLFKEPQDKAFSLSEDELVRPRNLIGGAKYWHELELAFLNSFNENTVDFINARIFRSYGKGSRDIISRWVRSLLQGEAISVFGGGNRFDYIFADDVAEYLVRLSAVESGVYNVGSGASHAVCEVVDILKKYFPDARINKEKYEGLYEASEANMQKTKKILNWNLIKTLDEGISEIIHYEKNVCLEDKFEGNVLITSISKKVSLIKRIRQAVEKVGFEAKIYGWDSAVGVLGAYFVDHFVQSPPFEELTFDSIVEYCQNEKIRYIFPTRDGELLFFAKNREKFEALGIFVFVSNEASVEQCLDKWKFYDVLHAEGLPVIPTSESGVVHERCVVKERVGAGSSGVLVDVGVSEAHKYGNFLAQPIYQPYIKGQEISVDVYAVRKGEVHGMVLRTRDVVVGGESQVTTAFRDERIDQVIRRSVEVLGLEGHAVFQGILDGVGDFHIMEANARFGGASSLSVECGLDSFYWFFLSKQGERLEDYPFIYLGDRRQVRVPGDVYVD